MTISDPRAEALGKAMTDQLVEKGKYLDTALEEAFLAGWEARHNLYSSEACHVARERQLKEWLATLER